MVSGREGTSFVQRERHAERSGTRASSSLIVRFEHVSSGGAVKRRGQGDMHTRGGIDHMVLGGWHPIYATHSRCIGHSGPAGLPPVGVRVRDGHIASGDETRERGRLARAKLADVCTNGSVTVNVQKTTSLHKSQAYS